MSATQLDDVLEALAAHGCRVDETGGGGLVAQCPAHDDHNPSLAIDIGEGGRVLLHCRAGCTFDDVLRALGMTPADLSPNGNGRRKIVATYPYEDESGTLLFEVVRFEPKGFAQRRPDGNGGHVWDLKGVRRVPYHLPQLDAAVEDGKRAWIVEGEKDVHALEAAGEVATCNPGGAGKWRGEYAKWLKDAEVVIVADADPPGRDHARKVARSLHGVAASVEVVEPAEGKDAADHLSAGRRIDEFVAVELGDDAPEPAPGAEGGLAASIDEWRPTDTYNSEQLVAAHGRDLLHASGLGWLCWDGRRWRRDDTGEAVRRAKQTAIAQREHAVATFGGAAIAMGDWATRSLPALALQQFDWSITSEQARRIDACLSLTATHETVAIRADDLDSHPDLLCVANGTLDLDTDELRLHRRDDRITRICEAAYDPDAESPMWLRFLERVQPDPEERAYLQRRLGSALSGQRLDHVLSVFYGEGRNGKSVFVDVVRAVLGDYAMESAEKLLVTDPRGGRSAGDESAVAQLAGRRLVTTSELATGDSLDEPLVKKLTGDRRMRAKLMRQDHFEFDLTATLVLVTNHKPRIVGTDSGIWSRMHLTPWEVFIPPEERDIGLTTKLIEAESDGILTWLVEGHRAYRERGLDPPQAVTKATDAYRAEQDPLAGWIADRCELAQIAETTTKALRASYTAWCEGQGARPVGARRFADVLRSHECIETRTGKERGWRGIRLRRENENAPFTGEMTPHDSNSQSPPPRARKGGNRETTSRGVIGPSDSGSTPGDSPPAEARAARTSAPLAPDQTSLLDPAPTPPLAVSIADIEAWLSTRDRIGLDTETTGLDPHDPSFRVTALCFADAAGSSIVLPGDDRELCREALRLAFVDGRRLSAHNAAYDRRAIGEAFGFDASAMFCTLTAHRTLHPSKGGHDLKTLAPDTDAALGSLWERWSEVIGKRPRGTSWLPDAIDGLGVGDPAVLAYVSADAIASARIADDLEREAEDRGLAEHVAMDQATARLWGSARLAVDRAALAERLGEVERRIADETEHFGFKANAGSNDRREWVESIGVEGLDLTENGAPSLDKDSRPKAIVPPEHRAEWDRLCSAIEAATQHSKLTELARLSERDGHVRPAISANGAHTGRQTADRPAVQNLPAALRPLLTADPGRALVGLDLSQVEPRLMAALSGDPALAEAAGTGDVYEGVAAACGSGIDRPKAKIVALAIPYGKGDSTLADDLGVSVAEAAAARERVLSPFPRLREWIAETARSAEAGATLTTITGRPLPEPEAGYMAVNYVIQGSAADVFKLMTLRVADSLPAGARMWLPIHDELVIEGDPGQVETVSDLLREHMREVVDGVLIDGEPHVHGERWGKA